MTKPHIGVKALLYSSTMLVTVAWVEAPSSDYAKNPKIT